MGEYGAKNTPTRPANRKCKELHFSGLLRFAAKIWTDLETNRKSRIYRCITPLWIKDLDKNYVADFFSNLTCFCYNPCILPYLCAPPLLPVATCAVVCCVQCIPAGFLTVSKWVTLIIFCNICMLIRINSAISRKTLLKPLVCKVWAGSHMVLLTASWPGCKCVCLLLEKCAPIFPWCC